jgi:transposase-like protein
MAASRRNHGPEVKKQCEKLVRQGTSIANIVQRLGVSKSYAKRVRAEIEAIRKADTEDEN